jgi:hypothetical protein
VDDLSAAIIALQDAASDHQRDTTLALRAMERKVGAMLFYVALPSRLS